MRSQVADHSAAPKPLAAAWPHSPPLARAAPLHNVLAVRPCHFCIRYAAALLRLSNVQLQHAGRWRATHNFCSATRSWRAARSARHCRVAQ